MTGLSSIVRQLIEAKAKATPGQLTIENQQAKTLRIVGHGPIVSGTIATVDCHWYHDDQQKEQRNNAAVLVLAANAIPSLASAVERLEKLAEDCEAKARDDTRRQGKRIVYGAIAADLRDILDGQP